MLGGTTLCIMTRFVWGGHELTSYQSQPVKGRAFRKSVNVEKCKQRQMSEVLKYQTSHPAFLSSITLQTNRISTSFQF